MNAVVKTDRFERRSAERTVYRRTYGVLAIAARHPRLFDKLTRGRHG